MIMEIIGVTLAVTFIALAAFVAMQGHMPTDHQLKNVRASDVIGALLLFVLIGVFASWPV